MLDITMTACIRPRILEQTLKSFTRNMLDGVRRRLIINIDPVGEVDKMQECFDVVERLMEGSEFVINTPSGASFPKAFRWCWQQVQAPYVLHLEDDWQLLAPVGLSEIISTLDRHKNLAIMRLSAFNTQQDFSKNWNKFLKWNGEFFEVQEQDRRRIGFCGHPSVIKRKWIDAVLPLMDDVKNPEKQLQFPEHNSYEILTEILKWRYGLYGKQNCGPTIKDIGRKWISESGWQKRGNRSFFTEWERSS